MKSKLEFFAKAHFFPRIKGNGFHSSSTSQSKMRALQKIEEGYKHAIKPSERFLLASLTADWSKEKPFMGSRVLINGHMTSITLAVIDLFIKSGALVETTVTPQLSAHMDTISTIKKSGIPFYKIGEIPEWKRQDYFDFCLDCGAGLLGKVKPKYGMVELTQTDHRLYSSIPFPVITVDKSSTKLLETLGTGESVVRLLASISLTAMKNLLSKNSHLITQDSVNNHDLTGLFAMMNINLIFSQKKYLIMGYGKVGKGVAVAIKNAGCLPKNIYIFDTSSEALVRAMEDSFSPVIVDSNENIPIDKLLEIFPTVYAVITATGIEGAMSKYFEPKHFARTPLLINMGTLDEFGHKLSKTMVLNNKMPANFMLERPTEVRFLDGPFCLWSYGCYELLRQKHSNGLSLIGAKIDRFVLNQWMARHGSAVKAASEEQNKVIELIDSVIHSPKPFFLKPHIKDNLYKKDHDKSAREQEVSIGKQHHLAS